MRIDLFELVDGLFKGVVYFFYNILETVFQLVWHPLCGPLRLHRRHRRPNRRQLGGLTVMFLGFFAFFAIHLMMLGRFYRSEDPSQRAIGEEVASAVVRAPSIDADWLWLVLATSLASTVIVDSVLRLVLSITGSRLRGHRDLVLESVEFALVLPLLLLIGLSCWPTTLIELADALRGEWSQWAVAAVPFVMLALAPAALLMAAGLRRPARRRRQHAVRIATLIGMAGMMLVATSAGARLGSDIDIRRYDQRLAATVRRLQVLDLQCKLSGPSPYVDAVLWNRSAEATVVVEGGLFITNDWEGLQNGSDSARARSYRVNPREGSAIPFQAGQVLPVRLHLWNYRFSEADVGQFCGLAVEGRRRIGDEDSIGSVN